MTLPPSQAAQPIPRAAKADSAYRRDVMSWISSPPLPPHTNYMVSSDSFSSRWGKLRENPGTRFRCGSFDADSGEGNRCGGFAMPRFLARVR
jgi:hypothetical protein